MSAPRIRFYTGGLAMHPTTAQARLIERWLGNTARCEIVEGPAAFEGLESADLLVSMGLHWTGMAAEWAGRLPYVSPTPDQRRGFIEYATSGRPLLLAHGGIASFDDWPEFAAALPVRWDWKVTSHLQVDTYTVQPAPEPHPLIEGVDPFDAVDEIYVNLQLHPGLRFSVHAHAPYHGAKFPMVISGSGGAFPESGRMVYLANGHDLRAFEAPAVARLWLNAIRWLTHPSSSPS
jgi:hypothetical protein